MKDYCASCYNRSRICVPKSSFETACRKEDYSCFIKGGPKDELNNSQKSAHNTVQETVRQHHVGNSNYSQMPKGYQPWDLWKIFHMNPWDADIQKRLLRTKAEPGMTMAESRKLDYEKIIHVCQERINQIDEGYEF